jgi:hypothetical protein
LAREPTCVDLRLERDPTLARLLLRSRSQTLWWYLRSRRTIAIGAATGLLLAAYLSLAKPTSRRTTHRLPAPTTAETAYPTILPGAVQAPDPVPTTSNAAQPTPTIPPEPARLPAFIDVVRCLSPVTLVVTGTGTGSNTLLITGPIRSRVAAGDDISVSITGPAGIYTVVDTDAGGHPGVFWVSRGSICAGGAAS